MAKGFARAQKYINMEEELNTHKAFATRKQEGRVTKIDLPKRKDE